MAEDMHETCDFRKETNILEYCKNAILRELQSLITNESNKRINILRRSKDLKRGDFLAIVQSWKSKKSKSLVLSANSENAPSHVPSENLILNDSGLQGLVDSLSFPKLEPFKASVCEVTKDRDILIKLERGEICRRVICEVVSNGERYGRRDGGSQAQHACINVAELMDSADWPGFSISHLRSMLLSDHIARLLEAVGYDVDFVQYDIEQHWKSNVQDFNIVADCYDCHNVDREQVELVRKELYEVMRNSRYFEKTKRKSGGDLEICGTEEGVMESIILEEDGEGDEEEEEEPNVVNLRTFLEDQKTTAIYDKNILLGDFSTSCDRLQDVAYLENYSRNHTKSRELMIHVSSQEKSFYLQTVDIGWQLVGYEKGFTLIQAHLVHGPVSSRGGQTPLFRADDLLQLRRKQMQSASILKYGDMVQGPGWDSTIHALTVAGIKFELLSTTCRQPAKLDVSDEHEDSGSAIDSRGGVFVMYNCARLSTLFSNYEKAVTQGIYPALPSAETLDFSLLRQEEEWALVFNYLLPYPSLVHDCVSRINQDGNRRPQVHSHKIAQFLQDLSRDLSSYYSRVHILGEPRPHLYPVMFCRLYLLKAIHQVMYNALHLLCITPLSQL